MPVSVLSNLSKVFENLIYKDFQSFCPTSNFLAKNQFGFRKNRNKVLSASTLMDKLPPALKRKGMLYVFLCNTLLASTHSLVQYFMIN